MGRKTKQKKSSHPEKKSFMLKKIAENQTEKAMSETLARHTGNNIREED